MERRLLWPLVLPAIALIALYGYCYTVRTADRLARDAASEARDRLENTLESINGLVDRFRSENIT